MTIEIKKTAFVIFCLLLFFIDSPYSKCQSDIDIRVRQLISEMTIDEKISQLQNNSPEINRLNIPFYAWGNECLHGLLGDDVTVFPQSIGLAATWDIQLIYKITTAISDEARIRFRKYPTIYGIDFWSPNINIFRDPRWGRGQETYGEDPFLTSKIAVSFIKGLQGNDSKYFKCIATPKHYAVHSGPEPLRHEFNAVTSERDFWETYMTAFKSAITEGKAYSIMSAYSAYLGVPISASKMMLTDILRTDWGFSGYVVSDCYAIGNIIWGHGYASSNEEAVAMAIKAGCDLDCGVFYPSYLKGALQQGMIQESDIDTAAFRLFKARFKLGLFDSIDSVPYTKLNDTLYNCEAHRQLAAEAARESIVLLKNQNNILPLKKDIKSIFVVGPNANIFLNGSYGGNNSNIVSIVQGIKNKVSADTKIKYMLGCIHAGSILNVIPSKYLKTTDGLPGLKGEYFNNINFEGTPVLTRIDSVINFDWGLGSPAPEVNNDQFSIRWSGKFCPKNSGSYTFLAYSDDGIRLYLDNKKIIDGWYDHPSYEYCTFDTLEAGKEYQLRIEYYEDFSNSNISLQFGNDSTDKDNVNGYTEEAKNYDIIIFAGGLSSNYECEESSLDIPGFYKGDRTNINLPTNQALILKALKKSGKPTILVLSSGSCLAVNWENDSIPAILQAWYPGEEGGTAIVDILFGDYNPSGKLPVTFYKSSDDLPPFENYYMDGRTYKYFNKEPLYPFGFGLSYTDFKYDNLKLTDSIFDISKIDSIPVIYNLTNSGNFDGDEIVQLYFKNLDSKFSQPLKQLIGFKRIHLTRGQHIRDTIYFPLKELQYFDTIEHKFVIDTGRYEIQVAASSLDVRLSSIIKIISESDYIPQTSKDKFDKIYPHPGTSYINFELNSIPDENYNIKLYQIDGKEIKINLSDYSTGNKFKLNCTGLSDGVYYLVLFNKTKKFTKRFFVVNSD